MQRRTLLKNMLALAVISGLPACGRQLGDDQPYLDAVQELTDWDKVEAFAKSVQRPQFPNQSWTITEFGAVGNDDSDASAAIRAAVDACHKAGGGKVIVPAGRFNTGPIHLLSNVNLHLQKDAVLAFSTDPQRYLPEVLTRWEGVELMGYSPLVYAFEQENIAVTGEGTLDGCADNDTWWPWKGKTSAAHWRIDPVEYTQKPARDKLFADAEAGVPVAERIYAEGAFLRPPFIQPYRCKKVLVEGVTINNSPFWLLNPVLCEDVTISGVTCHSHGPNSDGCDPESCNRVLIEDCLFDTGDDCIALKSGRNADGRRINEPVQNVLVRNCEMRDGHGGLVIGSEISGGARNIYLENCRMSSPNLERAVRIKTNSMRGGLIEHIRVRNVEVGQVQDAIVVNFYYEEGDAGQFDPVVRDIQIENLNVAQAIHAMVIRGFERAPINNFSLKDCHFKQVEKASVVEHVAGLQLDNVTMAGKPLSVNEVLTA